MKTYNDVYLAVRKELKMAGIEEFSLEARLLCSYAGNKKPEKFITDLKLYATEDYLVKVDELVRRRVAGEPMAYIAGEWEFYSLPIVVSPDVLIPRIDTELLAEKAISAIRWRKPSKRVLDLCAGSGCIGISIAANVPDSRVILIDNSKKALDICYKNMERNKVLHNVTCFEADALKTPPMLLGSFDMIVCNPPYIPTEDIKGLDISVKEYEPIAALDGGADGLIFYRAVASKWKSVIKPNGYLFFECGIGQAQDVMDIMEENGFTDITTFKDTLGIDRVVAGILK